MSLCCGMYQNQPFLPCVCTTSVAPSSLPRSAPGPFPVGPQGRLFQHRVPLAQAQPAHNHRTLAAGVHDHVGPHLALRPVLFLDAHADGPIAVEQHLQHAHALVHADALFAGVVQQHLVELAADDLPGLRTLMRLVIDEVERLRELAVLVDELHAVLLDEGAFLHLVEHVQPLEHPVGLRDQRFADVKAREMFALEQLHPMPLLGDQGGGGGPGGAAADDDDLRVGGHGECLPFAWRVCKGR